MRVSGGLAAAIAALVMAPAAHAAVVSDVSMYSDSTDYIGQGQQQVFGPSDNLTVTTDSGDPGSITINARDYTLEFAPRRGETLQDGVYDGAVRASSRTGAQPGIDINGDGRGCNTEQGRFEVKDIHVGSSGVPDRLWLVYEQHCEGNVPALFGEVRINEPADAGALTPLPAIVRWPVNGPGISETVVPVQFLATASGPLAAASIAGSDPGDFSIIQDACGGTNLSSGQACYVDVKFAPTGPGLRTATLQLTDATGTIHSVPLEGWTYGGTTHWRMNSDAGDFIGQGQTYDFESAQGLDVRGTQDGIAVKTAGTWMGQFDPAQGGAFAPGASYTNVQQDSSRGTAAGMDISGASRACDTISGDFSIPSVTYAPDGTMKTLSIKFDQYCNGSSAGLHGELDWRLGDTTPRAPWMGPGAPCSPPSCGPSDGGSGGSAGTSSGSTSSTGATGASGATGARGSTGPTGSTGSTAPSGSTGASSGPGSTNTPGRTGSTSTPGRTGSTTQRPPTSSNPSPRTRPSSNSKPSGDALIRATIRRENTLANRNPALQRALKTLNHPAGSIPKLIHALRTLRTAILHAATTVSGLKASSTRGAAGRRDWIAGARLLAKGLGQLTVALRRLRHHHPLKAKAENRTAQQTIRTAQTLDLRADRELGLTPGS